MTSRPSRGLLQFLVAVVALGYLVLLSGKEVTAEGVFRPIGLIASILALVLLVWDRYLWRAPLLNRLSRVPNIRGTWRGTLTSSWRDPGSGEQIAPDDDVYFVIRQTYWSVSAQLFSGESKSHSILGTVGRVADGQYALTAIYQNAPRALLRERSPIHHGAVMVDVSGSPPRRLEGFYWTERKTMGELEFTARSARLAGDIAGARALTYD